jgi:hypothetical protein
VIAILYTRSARIAAASKKAGDETSQALGMPTP